MIAAAIRRALDTAGVSEKDFRRVCHRLLDAQVIYRDPDNKAARELYELFLGMRELVVDYLRFLDIHVVHRPYEEFVIAYPPGAEHAYLEGIDTGEDARLQARSRKERNGLLLTCRLLYEEGVQRTEINERAERVVTSEDLYSQYLTIVGESFPENGARRKELFDDLKRMSVLRLVEPGGGDEPIIRLLPVVLGLTFGNFEPSLEEALETQGDLLQDLDAGPDAGPDAAVANDEAKQDLDQCGDDDGCDPGPSPDSHTNTNSDQDMEGAPCT